MSDIRRVDKKSKGSSNQSSYNYVDSYHDLKKTSNNTNETKNSNKSSKNYSLNKLSDQESGNELTGNNRIVRTKKSDSNLHNKNKNKKYDNKLIIETNSNTRRVKNRSASRSHSRDKSGIRSSRSRSNKSRAENGNRSRNFKTTRSKSKSPVNVSRSRSTSSDKKYYSKESKSKTKSKKLNPKQSSNKFPSKSRKSESPKRSPVSFERSLSPTNSINSRNSDELKLSKSSKNKKKEVDKKKSNPVSSKSKSDYSKEKNYKTDKKNGKKSYSSHKNKRSPSPASNEHDDHYYEDNHSIKSRESSCSITDDNNYLGRNRFKRSPDNINSKKTSFTRKSKSTVFNEMAHQHSLRRDFIPGVNPDHDDQFYDQPFNNRFRMPYRGNRYTNNFNMGGQHEMYEKSGPFGIPNSNRNQFGHSHLNNPYFHHKNESHIPLKYMGKYKQRYFQHPPSVQIDQELNNNEYDNYPPYYGSSNPRFYPNYRYNQKEFNASANYQHQLNKPIPFTGNQYTKLPKNKSDSKVMGSQELNTSPVDASKSEDVNKDIENPPTEQIDPELTKAVTEITEAIAAASAAGKEIVLTKEQQILLQKHEQIVQQHQRQQQQAQMPVNPALAKKLPNYRLLGRNIFDTGVKQQFLKKRVKANTYYSRFIKQHPTTNLPLAFQKSVSLAEDRANEEKENETDIINASSRSSSSSRKSNRDESNESANKSLKQKKKKHKKKNKNKKKKEKNTSQKNDKENDLNPEKNDEINTSSSQTVSNKSSTNSSTSTSSSSSSSSSSTSSSSVSSSSSDENSEYHKKQKSKKLSGYKRMSKTQNDNGDDSDQSMLDLRENLKPIVAYIRDREQMLDEMFRCIKGNKLQSMLPDIIKNKPFKEIRKRCLEVLDIMSKKRIRYLLADKQMTSSSGTDETSDDEQYNEPDRHASEEVIKKKEFTKFKPIGPDGNKSTIYAENQEAIDKINDNQNRESENENRDLLDSSENVAESITSQNISHQGGIAAAGFKKFIKKSISIKIKGNDQLNKIEIDEKSKEKNSIVKSKHINKIRQPSKLNLDDVKNLENETKWQNPSSDSEANLKNIQPNIDYQNEETIYHKSNIQYNRNIPISSNNNNNNNNNMMMMNPNHQRPPGSFPSNMPIMNLNLSVPPPNFNYPPSSVASHMNRSTNHQSLMYPPPSHPSQLQHLHILNNSYVPNNYLLVNQSLQNYHPSHPGIQGLGPQIIPTRNLNENMNKHMSDEDADEFSVNVNDDAAYDFDENENISDLSDELDEDIEQELGDLSEKSGVKNHKNSKKRSKHKKSSKFDSNDEFSELINDDIREDKIKNKKDKTRKKSNKHKKNDKSSDDEHDLSDIKKMLKNVLTMRINDLEDESDMELKCTLENILAQVVEDESLSFEEYSNIYQTVMSLIDLDQDECDENYNEDPKDYEIENENEHFSEKKRKRQDNSTKKHDLEGKDGRNMSTNNYNYTNMKKRKYQNNDITKNSDKNKFGYTQEDSITKLEIEAGEIEDI